MRLLFLPVEADKNARKPFCPYQQQGAFCGAPCCRPGFIQGLNFTSMAPLVVWTRRRLGRLSMRVLTKLLLALEV